MWEPCDGLTETTGRVPHETFPSSSNDSQVLHSAIVRMVNYNNVCFTKPPLVCCITAWTLWRKQTERSNDWCDFSAAQKSRLACLAQNLWLSFWLLMAVILLYNVTAHPTFWGFFIKACHWSDAFSYHMSLRCNASPERTAGALTHISRLHWQQLFKRKCSHTREA